jgi:hypothetical protein
MFTHLFKPIDGITFPQNHSAVYLALGTFQPYSEDPKGAISTLEFSRLPSTFHVSTSAVYLHPQ